MTFEVGRKLGTYEIICPLGVGGMGEVYRARDSRLKREVAIKVLPDRLTCDTEAVSRFKSEALILASLNHPNVASIYGLEEFSGQQFLVMELVEGETLLELLLTRNGPVPIEEALTLCSQVAEALEAAHLKMITHRDVKPSNVKVTPEGRVKVLDFGLAKALRVTEADQDLSQLSTNTTFNQPGTITGTPSYMSPEQARGKPVDNRTDIWAFGCLLYELLAGKRAFRGETISDILAAILEREPDWQALPSATPGKVKDLLRRCLQKDADLRFSSMREVITDLEAARKARRGWGITRRKAVVGGAAVVVLPLILFSWPNIVHQWRALMLPKQKNVLVMPFRCIGENLEQQTLCDGLTETVTTALSKHGEISVVPAISAHNIKNAQQARNELFVNVVVSGTLERRPDMVRLTLSITDPAQNRLIETEAIDWPVTRLWKIEDAVLQKLVTLLNLPPTSEADISAAASSPVPGVTDAYLRGRGYLNRFDRPGNLDSALREFDDAAHRDSGFALAYVGIAETYLRIHRTNQQPDALERGRQAAERAQQINPKLAPPHVALGAIWSELGKYEDAIYELQTAETLDPRDPAPILELGLLYYRLKRNTDAEAIYAKAMALRPGDWLTFRSAASFYDKTQKFEEAERYFREVTRLTPDNDEGYRNLGGVLIKLGRPKEAEEALLTAARLKPTMNALSNLGALYIQQHDFKKAVSAMKQAAALDSKRKQFRVWGNLGDAYLLASDRVQAQEAWQQAATIVRNQLKGPDPDVELFGYLAKFEAKTGEASSAQQHIEVAIKKLPESATVRYQAGIVYALLGQKGLAIGQLDAAIKLKYSREEIQQAPELVTLHGDPRYEQLFTNPLAKP